MIIWLQRQLQKLHKQPRSILQTLLYGAAAGCAAVAFQKGINWLYGSTYIAFRATNSPATFLIGSFCVIVVCSLIVGVLLYRCPEAAGSGIPQLKLAFWKDFGFVRARVIAVKFIAGVLSIGGGNSLGREGPSVHLAGALASNVAGLLGEPKQRRRVAVAAGAAAGLAAAFNTPIAAVTFVLEEIVEDLNSRLLGSMLLAAVVGAFVVHGLIGKQPAFNMADVEPSSWRIYLLIPVTAAVASFVGLTFQKGTLRLRGALSHNRQLPKWIRPVIGGIFVWLIGSSVFLTTHSLGVFSLGYDDLSQALTTGFAWKLAGVLVITKLAGTILCYGWGGCGGIFSPMLFFGGMTGIFLAGLFNFVTPISLQDAIVLAVVGMSSCLGAVVRAPITSILIVFEMTHEFSMVPALMLGTIVSQTLSRRLSESNFYEAVLLQDGHHVDKYIPPRDLQAWQKLPISAIANSKPVFISDLSSQELRNVLEKYPYAHFPVLENDSVTGMLTRQDAVTALETKDRPKVLAAVACEKTKTIRDVQQLIIESPTHTVLLRDQPNGPINGIITLHDLLRAQVAMTDGDTA